MDEEEKFSDEGISKKVNEEILNHSLTLYPGAGGVLALLWGGLFSSTGALVIGGLGIAASIGHAVYQKYFKSNKLSKKYIDQAREEQKQQLIAKLDSLGPELVELGCDQGAQQVEQLSKKFDGLQETIVDKLSNDPTTASKLSALAERLYLATIDNLLHAKQILKSVDDIDLDYIDTQLARAHNEIEKESLEERKKLKLDGINEAEVCIANNEVAMTKINMLSISLAKSKKSSSFDMESSLHEITNNVRVEQWERN